MIDLYASTTPNVMKVTLALCEMDLDFRFLPVNVWKGEQFSSEFEALNPNSKVPVLVDRDDAANPVTVFESVAILIYLAEKTGRLLPASGRARYEAIEWAIWQAANLGPASGQLNHFLLYAPQGQDYALSRHLTELRRCYAVMERRLSQAPYLGGDDCTIADLACFPWVWSSSNRLRERFPFLDGDSPDAPGIAAWFARCAARPGIRRGIERHARLTPLLATASPDDLDRIFGRGRYAFGR